MNVLRIPELSLIVLAGPRGAGQSTFAQAHFRPDEVLSRSLPDLHRAVEERLRGGRLTVVEGTYLRADERRPLVALARRHHCPALLVVLDLPLAVCRARLETEEARREARQGCVLLHQGRHKLGGEGFTSVVRLESAEQVAALRVERVPMPADHRHLTGPFDVIGDVHGCADELVELLGLLGYVATTEGPAADGATYRMTYRHPEGRTAVFLGDLVDRGPRVLDTVQLVVNMVAAGSALGVPGNHDLKWCRAARGRGVQLNPGLSRTLAEVAALPEEVRTPLVERLVGFLEGLPSHLVLDGGRLVVAHAGLREELHGRDSPTVTDCCLYGEVVSKREGSAPVVNDWVAEYRGPALVVYGHVPVARPLFRNNTFDLDTGCCFGGRLSALRYPEGEVVWVTARQMYVQPKRPLAESAIPAGLSGR